jgi:hypothetical protein
VDLGRQGSKHSIGVCGAFLIGGNISKSSEGMNARSERENRRTSLVGCPLLKKRWDVVDEDLEIERKRRSRAEESTHEMILLRKHLASKKALDCECLDTVPIASLCLMRDLELTVQ